MRGFDPFAWPVHEIEEDDQPKIKDAFMRLVGKFSRVVAEEVNEVLDHRESKIKARIADLEERLQRLEQG